MSQGWEEIDHTADWALRVWGEDLRALFENAALGMVSLIDGTANPSEPITRHEVALDAPDHETLLVDWLTELLVLIEEEHVLFDTIRVRLVMGLHLEAEAGGRQAGQFSKHIKAVTYHNLAIRQTAQGFETTIVFDV